MPRTRIPVLIMTCFAAVACGVKVSAQSNGLPKLATAVAFPNLKFDRPVALAYPDDGGNLLFVIEQHQTKVWSFPNEKETSDKQVFLQVPDPISKGNEEGLLGLAFHPKYKENGQFFVYYSANDEKQGHRRRSVVSRFKVSKDDPRKADPTSEERIWVSADDPFENHNGGCIAFGPDGFLYITLGDSGAADDPLTTGQNPTDFFGSILRIDVDHPSGGKPYGIPKDNPFSRGGALCEVGARSLLHRPAERLEIHLRPQDRRPLGGRRGPESLGNRPPDQERRQLRLEHQGRLPPVPTSAPAEARRRRAAQRRRSPNIRTLPPPTARTTAKASPAGTCIAARNFRN